MRSPSTRSLRASRSRADRSCWSPSSPGTPLRLERQPDNPYDANACALHDPSGAQVGYLNRRLAAVLAPVIDAGVEYDVAVTEVTGGAEGRSRGVNVLVSRRAERDEEEASESSRDRRASLETLGAEALEAELVTAFIGEGRLHEAQQAALASLDDGLSTLAVMATGRGKSLIFQLHAAPLQSRRGRHRCSRTRCGLSWPIRRSISRRLLRPSASGSPC